MMWHDEARQKKMNKKFLHSRRYLQKEEVISQSILFLILTHKQDQSIPPNLNSFSPYHFNQKTVTFDHCSPIFSGLCPHQQCFRSYTLSPLPTLTAATLSRLRRSPNLTLLQNLTGIRLKVTCNIHSSVPFDGVSFNNLILLNSFHTINPLIPSSVYSTGKHPA